MITIVLFSQLSICFTSLIILSHHFLFSFHLDPLFHSGFFFYFPYNLALHILFFQGQFVSQNGRVCLSWGEELCPIELFWSDKQPAWIGQDKPGQSSPGRQGAAGQSHLMREQEPQSKLTVGHVWGWDKHFSVWTWNVMLELVILLQVSFSGFREMPNGFRMAAKQVLAHVTEFWKHKSSSIGPCEIPRLLAASLPGCSVTVLCFLFVFFFKSLHIWFDLFSTFPSQ